MGLLVYTCWKWGNPLKYCITRPYNGRTSGIESGYWYQNKNSEIAVRIMTFRCTSGWGILGQITGMGGPGPGAASMPHVY